MGWEQNNSFIPLYITGILHSKAPLVTVRAIRKLAKRIGELGHPLVVYNRWPTPTSVLISYVDL